MVKNNEIGTDIPKSISIYDKNIKKQYRKKQIYIKELIKQRNELIKKSKELNNEIRRRKLDLTNLQLNNNIIITKNGEEIIKNEK